VEEERGGVGVDGRVGLGFDPQRRQGKEGKGGEGPWGATGKRHRPKAFLPLLPYARSFSSFAMSAPSHLLPSSHSASLYRQPQPHAALPALLEAPRPRLRPQPKAEAATEAVIVAVVVAVVVNASLRLILLHFECHDESNPPIASKKGGKVVAVAREEEGPICSAIVKPCFIHDLGKSVRERGGDRVRENRERGRERETEKKEKGEKKKRERGGNREGREKETEREKLKRKCDRREWREKL
jgi:hypothetical protein